jgi:protein-disulfide isomerase
MGKREEVKRRKQQQETKNNLTIILIIAAFVIVIVGMVLLTQYKPVGDVVVADRKIADQVDGLTMGSPDAKVKVIEFADFQCPACASYWSQMEPGIIDAYINTGKVQFTYSPFSFLGQGQSWDESVKAAEAAYCANDQQKFWEYRDIIFANHNGENQGAYSRERLIAFAKEIGLDQTAFKECLDSEKYAQKVADHTAFAESQGATYTPSFLINGKIVNAGELVQTIENALAE